MNDRHPSGTMTTPAPASDADPAHYASYGTGEAHYGDLTTYGGYDATGFSTGATTTTGYGTDPFYGSLPGQASGGYDATGTYDTTQWTHGTGQHLSHDPYATQHHTAYDTGAYDASAWAAGHDQPAAVPPQGPSGEATGQWDTGAWAQPDQSGAPADATQQWAWGTHTFATGTFDTGAFDTGTGAVGTGTGDTGTFDTGAFDTGAFATGTFATPYTTGTFDTGAHHTAPYADAPHDTGAYDATRWNPDGTVPDTGEHLAPEHSRAAEEPAPHEAGPADTGALPAVPPLLDDQEEIALAPRVPAARTASRSRRRQPAKRSALLTIAVPSACVMSVAGIAAASVGGLTGEDGAETTASAADAGQAKAAPVQPSTANNKLDTQLTSLAAGADDFADRASRTQERIDLKAQQVAEKRRAAEEAARKERLRPKFALPVEQHGLSAYYGQAGVNWMSVHTGIDFPVFYGTSVKAATDGTVRTQFNSAYGNMAIVTAKDGTETWYCHLSSYQVPSGSTVKAGDTIAFSGDSGNSTGPHLHFEVRPAGGSAIDPLPWLRSHGLNPQ